MTSTSEAARRASTDRDTAAIGSEAAAFRYGLRVWDRVRGVRKKNVTQFILFGKQEPGTIVDPRTAIGFGLAHRAGTLAAVLTELARAELNLTRIVSRPFPGKAGEYLFLVEFEGDQRDPRAQAALKAVRHATTFLRVLGTYPVARQIS